VSIESLAARVHAVYSEFVREGEEYPTASPDSDNAIWVNEGDSPSELIREMIECDDLQIADDIVSILSEDEQFDVVREGASPRYDGSSEIYKIVIPQDGEIANTWQSFRQSIKHTRRFFNEGAARLLSTILEPILSGAWSQNVSAIREIGPTDPDRFIYRGRQANDDATRLAIYQSPIRQLSAPPQHLNVAGRMNAAGTGAFYGSFDRTTCAAELRTPVGGRAIIGKFELCRTVRVLDLTVLDTATTLLSYFDPDFVEKHAYMKFIRGFHSEIKRPVIPGRETLEYLPTQFVCEYLWTQVTPRLDGLIYGSSQLSEAANNIVLFPHAIDTEGYEQESSDTSISIFSSQQDEDDEYGLDHIVSQQSPSEPADTQEDGSPTLRLLIDEITTSHVRAISYNTEERPTYRSFRTPEREPDAYDLDLEL
jgi:hypothetical protein